MSKAPRIRMRDLSPRMQAMVREQDKKLTEEKQRAFIAWVVAAGLPKPEPEHRFHPTRKWRFDWAWPDQKVALEVEGGFYGKGEPCPTCGQREVAGHTSIERLKSDMEKYSEAAAHGWRIVRCTPEQLHDASTLDLLRRALAYQEARMAVKLTIYESAAGGFYVHPEGQRFNTEARFDTRAEAEAYIANPPPAPRTYPMRVPGLELLTRPR